MNQTPTRNKARNWLAAAGLLAASALGIFTLAAPGASGPAQAAAPTGTELQGKPAGNPIRRESLPPVLSGPAPRTGPASAFRPLDAPNFGDNHRANTDTQAPNLAQQEPSIAVNPTNPLNVVAAAKDERAGTNTKQIWIYTSTDGGVTWINQQFPLTAPPAAFSSDPIVNFSDDGECYVTALPYGGGSNNGIQVARSTDGGITFSTGVHLPGSNGNSDKEWTWVDNSPASPFYHRIYDAWMDFGQGNIISFNYSSDRGVTWSPKITIGSATQFPMPVTLPNGDIILTYYTGNVVYRRSTDGGSTWAAAQTISSISNPPCPPDNAGCGIWRMNPIPANSVNPLNGSMVVAWADGRTSGNARIYYSRSTNSGSSWSAAAPLAPSGVAGTYQVEPWVASDEAGIFHAVWYDDRENPNTSVFNIYYSQSTDDGATWSNAVRITTATSDLRIGIPTSYAGAAGDYINVTASHGNVYAVWTDTRQGSGEDVYVVRGTYGGGGTPTATVTGTPPTATQTVTRPPATVTPTFSPTPCALGPIESFETGLGTYASSVGTCVPGGCGWTSVTTAAHTGTHSAFAPDLSNISDQYLATVSAISVPPGATLSFWHSWDLENTFDGGVLEFSTNNGSTWTDAGAAILTNGYNGTISSGFQSPISGRQAWTGSPNGSTFVETRVSLAAFAGQNLSIRFREANDNSVSATGWWVDDVAILAGACGSVTPQPTATGTNTPTTGVPTATPTLPQPPATGTATSTTPPGVTGTPTSQATATSTGTPPTPLPTVTECPISFTDVPVGSTFYTWIKCLACRGIINGYPDGTFRPNNNVTRGQLSKIVSNSAGFSDPATQMFEDVPPGSTFFDYIGRLASRGYISGYPCGSAGEPCVPPGNLPYFRPNANATRGQISKIVANAAGFIEPVSGQTFEDVAPGSTFYEFIERLASRGVMSGYPCGAAGEPCVPPENRPYFRPNNNATRGQTSKIVANTFFPACDTPTR